MQIIPELQWRGLIHQTTDGLIEHLQTKRTVYLGIDATADSLHVGHLVMLLTLRRFQQAGHRTIVLIGDATGMIGDPSGKNEERKLLNQVDVGMNAFSITEQITRLVSVIVVNNLDWMRDYRYLDFLRYVGKHFPVNVMLTKDSVKSRMESGLSYTEFSYMLLQAYDFVKLWGNYGCTLQIGGSDQWGNITAGIDLARRMDGEQLYGLTCPLLTKSDGTKMGKTENGALWLDANKTSPYDFFQYWVNIDDADVRQCLCFFTDLDMNEINALMARHESDPCKRIAQRRLAMELTNRVHHGTPRFGTIHRSRLDLSTVRA